MREVPGVNIVKTEPPGILDYKLYLYHLFIFIFTTLALFTLDSAPHASLSFPIESELLEAIVCTCDICCGPIIDQGNKSYSTHHDMAISPSSPTYRVSWETIDLVNAIIVRMHGGISVFFKYCEIAWAYSDIRLKNLTLTFYLLLSCQSLALWPWLLQIPKLA